MYVSCWTDAFRTLFGLLKIFDVHSPRFDKKIQGGPKRQATNGVLTLTPMISSVIILRKLFIFRPCIGAPNHPPRFDKKNRRICCQKCSSSQSLEKINFLPVLFRLAVYLFQRSLRKHWTLIFVGSMGLVYLPTCTIKINTL